MKLSSKSRYGLSTIFQLALEYGKGRVRVKTIAKGKDFTAKYIEQLIAKLNAAGLVISTRGRNGGYVLARHPSKIKVSEVINAIEEPTQYLKCTKHSKFTKGCNDCIARHIWSKINGTIWEVYESTTLQDLIDMKK